MTHRTTALLLALAVLGSAVPASAASTTQLAPRDAALLRSRATAPLRALRGGRVDVPPLRADEKATLQLAQTHSPGLAALRAGDGGGIIVIALLVVILLLLL